VDNNLFENKKLNHAEEHNLRLTKVSAFCSVYDGKPSNDIEALLLGFSGFLIQIEVSTDDDCLRILTEGSVSSFDIERNVTSFAPWVDCVGCCIREYYIMINNRGYSDAIQFEFSGTGKVVQLYGIASRIDVRSVESESLRIS